MNEKTGSKLPLPARVCQDGLFLLGLQQLISKTLGPGSGGGHTLLYPPPTPVENRCEAPQDVAKNASRKRKKCSNSGLSDAEKRQKRCGVLVRTYVSTPLANGPLTPQDGYE